VMAIMSAMVALMGSVLFSASNVIWRRMEVGMGLTWWGGGSCLECEASWWQRRKLIQPCWLRQGSWAPVLRNVCVMACRAATMVSVWTG